METSRVKTVWCSRDLLKLTLEERITEANASGRSRMELSDK